MLFHADPHRSPHAAPAAGSEAHASADPSGGGRPLEAIGFPSPARDYYHGGIDLNRHLIRDRTSTFIMRVAGNSMAASGIADGDELIVDRSLAPRDGSVVVAVLDGELAVRRLRTGPRGVALATDDGGEPTEVGELADLTVWGVVTRCLHHV